MLFGPLQLVRLPEGLSELVLDDGFRGGFAQTLEQFEGFVVTLRGVGEIAFPQREPPRPIRLFQLRSVGHQ